VSLDDGTDLSYAGGRPTLLILAHFVIPAHSIILINQQFGWIPAFAGMTQEGCFAEVSAGEGD
jgi:hypothetical protein